MNEIVGLMQDDGLPYSNVSAAQSDCDRMVYRAEKSVW